MVEIDPQLGAIFAAAVPVTERPTIAQMRERSRQRSQVLSAAIGDRFTPARSYDLTVANLSARVYWPDRPGPLPTVVYLHGGGWVMGNRDSHAAPAQRICVEGGVVVVAVDYRLAPEYAFPTAFEDCLAAVKEIAQRVDEFGGAELALAGASAGAQLGASVAMALPGQGVQLAAQLVLFPTTDASGGYADAEVNARYPSRHTRDLNYGLTMTELRWFVQQYLPNERDWADWRASPLFGDLSQMPPTVLHTAGYDLLCDEGNALAAAIAAAGVPVVHREFANLTHAFVTYSGLSAAADAATSLGVADLMALLGR
jgi:acetyl esterase